MKRQAEDDTPLPEKRLRLSAPDRLSSLSDELILRVLSTLQPADICICQRLSHKFGRLAGDSSLWRTHYFERFVRPRSSRVPVLRTLGQKETRFPTNASKWLDEHHLVEDRGTDWKQQYRLRHNWSRGNCDVGEITVAEQPHIPPMIVQMHQSIIFTADAKNGLRAWSAKGGRDVLAQILFPMSSPPTSMTVGDSKKDMMVAIGFEDGRLHVYKYDGDLTVVHQQKESSGGVVTSLAMSWPFVLSMSATQQLNLFQYPSAELLHSLRASNIWTPLSVSLRHAIKEIVISVAYSLPTYLSGWTVGVQEIFLTHTGQHVSSRTASAIDQHYRPLAFTAPPMLSHLRTGRPALLGATEFRHIHSKPNSLSYTHPYLLVSHPDNTLTLYLVFSTTEALTISAGSRLWGHTSSVSGAHVGGRGKAVSISRRGDELRIWELEGGFNSDTARKRLASGDLSVRVKPISTAQTGIDLTNAESGNLIGQDELSITRGWIGFDAENVAVLREESNGKQALVVYDFT